MQKTKNLQLSKPNYEDVADIEIINNNFDIIDDNMKQIEIESKNKDGGNADTLDGKHAKDFAKYIVFDSIDKVFETEFIGMFKVILDENIIYSGISFASNEFKSGDETFTDYLRIYYK